MEALVPQVVPFLLVMFRLSGLFVIAPVLASVSIPGRARVLLVFALALCVFPLTPTAGVPLPQDVVSLAAAVAMEVLLGFVLGLLMLLPVAALQLAGSLMGLQLGFGLGAVINPALESESDVISETLMVIALGAFIAMGGLEVLLACVAATFRTVPLGAVATASVPADLVMGAFAGGFELAIRIAAPVLGILMVETVISAFLMKTMPQLNILSIGFAIKIVLGLLAIAMALQAIDAALVDAMSGAGRAALRWSAGVPGGGG
ncbi:MAG: flagellar biosynthetic protein FliR [Phycisphaeraceae bacterium]|nr:flagellar biosynthetic protein FliR [Phycisphaeraceae bacterium]